MAYYHQSEGVYVNVGYPNFDVSKDKLLDTSRSAVALPSRLK